MTVLPRHLSLAIFIVLLGCCAAAVVAQEKAKDDGFTKTKKLFDGKTLDGWKQTQFGGEGEVRVENGQIILEMGDPLTGITWKSADDLPKDNYEISLSAMKLKGDDFFVALTFPVRDTHASFIVGGWAGGVAGISSLDGFDASENETTTYQKFDHNRWYKIRVRVVGNELKAWVDDKKLVDVDLKDRKLSTRSEVDLSKPLGISNYHVKSALKDIQIRSK